MLKFLLMHFYNKIRVANFSLCLYFNTLKYKKVNEAKNDK